MFMPRLIHGSIRIALSVSNSFYNCVWKGATVRLFLFFVRNRAHKSTIGRTMPHYAVILRFII